MVRNQKENRCFSCIGSGKRRLKSLDERYLGSPSPPHSQVLRRHSFSDATDHNRGGLGMEEKRGMGERVGSNRGFTLAELMLASNNFKPSQLIGEGGFGKVYKGLLNNGQVVAIKRLNLDGLQGNQEFIIEVLLLSLLNHPNLVNLIGYCAEGDQRLLVYEYMPKGSLEDHLFGIKEDKQVMDWNTRVKVAVGAAKGLEHLHCEAKPPIIYRDLKAANILLDKDFNPKLSDFGLAKLGPVGDKTHVSTRVMGTYGYCAPEYAMTGKLTLKSDIFSFGVLLLEIVTGKRTFDPRRKMGEHSLVASSRPYLKDRRKYMELVDPRLRGRYSKRSARHMIAVTTMCLSEEATQRPSIKEIVAALEFLATECDVPTGNNTTPPISGSSTLDL